MSATIDGTTISLTRGDSLILDISITRNDEPYVPVAGDSIRFALKHQIADDDPVILKDCNMETMQLTLDPSDTKELSFGSYRYDIELTTVDGYVDTFIGPATFRITEEVY